MNFDRWDEYARTPSWKKFRDLIEKKEKKLNKLNDRNEVCCEFSKAFELESQAS